MTCKEIAELTSAHLSGELEVGLRAHFDQHVASCRDCAHAVESEAANDVRLRLAFDEPLPDASAMERAVRGRILRQRTRLWAVAAAAVVLAVSGYALFAPNRVLRDAALDHRLEVALHQPRRWRTDAVEIGKLASRYALKEPSALAPTGFRLEKAKMCGLAGQPALHLVFTDGAREVSVFVRADRSFHAVAESSAAGERLAAFANGNLQVVVASESAEVCGEFARAAQRML